MKIIKTQVLRGPNVWSNYRNRLIQVRLDLEEMENFPTDKIEGFFERLTALFPTIRELIDEVNSQPGRGEGHEAPLTKIKFDKDTFFQLEKYNYTIESIPAKNETVYLKSTANLSTGGTAEDMTDEIHPENKFMAERIARIIGLDICGIDIMAPNISEPLQGNGGVVLEVNAAPGFRMHLEPSKGTPRNVAKPVIDMLYPDNAPGTIPLFAITGTNGKTTTTRLLAHMAKIAGYTPGYTTTDGIYINGYKIKDGDCTALQADR
jgi:cyanophycin synthetase